MNSSTIFSAAAELTLREVIADMPHDAGAVVVGLMLGAMIFLTWYGSRRSTVEKYGSRSRVEPPTPHAAEGTETPAEAPAAPTVGSPPPSVPSARIRLPRSRAKSDRTARAE